MSTSPPLLASNFVPPPRANFPPWARYVSYVPLYGIALPIVKALELARVWPRILGGRGIPSFPAYQPTEHDVFVCSYFKSGTTWMLQIAIQIAHKGKAEFANIHHAVAWPDCPPPMARYVIPLDDASPVARSPTRLRVIKTHHSLDRIPFAADARYVAVVRDPKDVCVSGYHFLKAAGLGPLMPSVDNWVRFFLSPTFFQGTWAEHVSGYWSVRQRPNALFLTFEEVKRDSRDAIRRVAELMNVPLTTDELEAIFRRADFGHMKREGAKFDPGQMTPWSGQEYMLRKGERGGAGELLSAKQQRRIDDHCRAELERLGCDFPYDDAFRIAR